MYGQANTQTLLQSETADNIAWSGYASYPGQDKHNSLTDALSRVHFTELATPYPLHAAVEDASSLLNDLIERKSKLLVMAGRSRRLAAESHHMELKQLMDERGSVGSEVKKTIGDVATAFVVSGCKAGLVVVQAAHLADA